MIFTPYKILVLKKSRTNVPKTRKCTRPCLYVTIFRLKIHQKHSILNENEILTSIGFFLNNITLELYAGTEILEDGVRLRNHKIWSTPTQSKLKITPLFLTGESSGKHESYQCVI